MSGVNAHKTRRLAREASHLAVAWANYPFGIDGKRIVIIRASPKKSRIEDTARAAATKAKATRGGEERGRYERKLER